MRKLVRLNGLLTIGLGIVFLSAAWYKTHFPYEFLGGVYSYGLVGPGTGLYIAALLPWIELILGLCLVTGALLDGALILATALGAVFVFVQTWALAQGLDISCSCFGSGSGTINYTTLGRTILIFALCLLSLVLLHRERRGQHGVAP